MGKWIENNLQEEKRSQNYCGNCASFQDYGGQTGWCSTFNQRAKSHHQMTGDCVLNGAIALLDPEGELNLPKAEYQIGDVIKLIDDTKSHEQWTTCTVLEIYYNQNLYRSQESYLNQAQWYFKILAASNNQFIWIAENLICLAEQSHLITTEDIF